MEDLLLALDDNMNVEEVLAEIEHLFALIGLEVNKDKCKCTRTEDITFMGISFSCNKQERIPLAPQLQIKTHELID